jgi:hypothetical protein
MWRLLLRVGDFSPMFEVWEFSERGRRYYLAFRYVFDEQGRKILFRPIVLRSRTQMYEFNTLEGLYHFFRKKSIPVIEVDKK